MNKRDTLPATDPLYHTRQGLAYMAGFVYRNRRWLVDGPQHTRAVWPSRPVRWNEHNGYEEPRRA